VTEAAYSHLGVVTGPRSRRRSTSLLCACLTVTAALVSVLLNIAMSAMALTVIVSVTSPADFDVICVMLRSLRCGVGVGDQTAEANCSTTPQISTQHGLNETVRIASATASDIGVQCYTAC